MTTTVPTADTVPPPNGCGRCEIALPHGWQYTPAAGLHQWTPPTQGQILARMKARRERRLTVKPVYHATTRWAASSNPEATS
ncbi:hypothetical protein ACWGH7_16440 [Streptomyces cyaneofuscatus]